MPDHELIKSGRLGAIRQRLPFNIARSILKASGFPTGRGWDEVIDKVNADEVMQSASLKKFDAAYVEALIFCDKLVTIYPISDSELAPAHKHAEALRNQGFKNSFSERFPFALTKTALAALPTNDPNGVSVVECESGTAIIYATSRLIETREELPANQLNPVLVGTYSSFIGIRKEHFQANNAIYIPNFGNYIAVLTDTSKIVGLTDRSAILDQISLRNAMNQSYGSVILNKPMNMFSAIRNLYFSKEGNVCLLSHAVAKGIKHERMRHGKCVREEQFHLGGKDAVSGNLDPYQIIVRWDMKGEDDFEGRPELSLLGDYKMIYQAAPQLTEAQIRNCVGHTEWEYVVDRLIAHI